jgi:hypothetical protein
VGNWQQAYSVSQARDAQEGKVMKQGRMIHCKATQAHELARYLRLNPKGMTYMQLILLCVSSCPWKRLQDGTNHLRPGERIARKIGNDGLTRIYITRAKP